MKSELQMARIVAALFDEQASAERALEALSRLGVPAADMEHFSLTSPGKHHTLPMGGDEEADRDAKDGDEGALRGAALGGAVGAALGLVATPLVGPAGVAAGIGAGAYVGSLAGATQAMGAEDTPVRTVRPAGVMVASVLGARDEASVVGVFEREGAKLVETAEGSWGDGHWTDFDPVAPPQRVVHLEGNPSYPT